MCGIVGFLHKPYILNKPKETLQNMADSLSYRGPDGHGVWYDEKTGFGAGHRRLSIIDLSSEGHQPMVSSGGRFVISYNGEVYNFNTLRIELEKKGQSFRGHSDTEVILAAIEVWGLENALSRFIGMFAFALWDKIDHQLYLIRDRLGIKPLYYGFVNDAFLFSSELKAFRCYPGFSQPVNRDAVTLLLRHGYIGAPYTIYKDIQKLLPGHVLKINLKEFENREYSINAYWSASSIVEQSLDYPFAGSPAEAVNQLDALLRDSVALRMLADVPLGTFLSGGVDSSVVTALMQVQSKKPIKTFSIGFREPGYNEAEYAKAVAKHLGTEHTELYVSPEEAMDVIPKLSTIFDEPFADPSQIPTFLVSKLARRDVTVSLSGDGGDELFYGYKHYFATQRIWQKIGWIPPNIRTMLGRILSAPFIPRVRKLGLLTEFLNLKRSDDCYHKMISAWENPKDVVIDSEEPLLALTSSARQVKLEKLPQRMMFFDLISYLPDDILVKVDRASMAVSLEARVPILDHRVVEFAWRLPQKYKVLDGHGKWVLRQVLYKYVPREIVDRPKMGFGVPIGAWLRAPLRDWAEELLNEQRLKEDGYFNSKTIRTKWQEHINGKSNLQYQLWNVLMFQAWIRSH